MNYQFSNFLSEGSWNENVKNGLKAEIPLIICQLIPFYIEVTWLNVKIYLIWLGFHKIWRAVISLESSKFIINLIRKLRKVFFLVDFLLWNLGETILFIKDPDIVWSWKLHIKINITTIINPMMTMLILLIKIIRTILTRKIRII